MKDFNQSGLRPAFICSVILFFITWGMQGCLGEIEKKDKKSRVGTQVENDSETGFDDPLGGDNNDEVENVVEEDEVEVEETPTEEAFFANLPKGALSLTQLCSTPGNDRLRNVFCSGNPPPINSLADLQAALNLRVGVDNVQFAVSTTSPSLVSREVNSLVPRAVIFDASNNAPNDFCVMGFTRSHGQFAEIICRDPVSQELKFFIGKYEKTCNQSAAGCLPADYYMPDAESGWAQFSIYEDEALKNTVFDCRQCHQSGGPATAKVLRMQSRENPWFGWCRDNRPNGQAVLADIQAVHGNETYAGIPANQMSNCDPADLEDLLIDFNMENLPGNTTVDTGNVEDEVQASQGGDLRNNTTPGLSATWEQNYRASLADEEPGPIRYRNTRNVSPALFDQYAQLYNNVMSGVLPRNMLPDLMNATLSDDAELRAMGRRPAANATPQELLHQACFQCHNSRLDQTITRSKFNVNLALMSNEELDIAITRIGLPGEDIRLMPPDNFTVLNAQEKQTLINLLQAAKK